MAFPLFPLWRCRSSSGPYNNRLHFCWANTCSPYIDGIVQDCSISNVISSIWRDGFIQKACINTSHPTLQWRHLSVMASQTIGNSITRCQHVVQTDNKEAVKIPFYCLFMRGIQEWLVDSSHEEPVKRKGLPHHDVIIYEEMTIVQDIIE